MFLHNGFTHGPGFGIGWIRLRLWCRANNTPALPAAARHRPRARPRAKKAAAVHLRRLHELGDGERARGPAGLAIECGRGERDGNGRWFSIGADRLPGLRRERRLDIGIACVHGPLVGSRLATWVGDVGHDPVAEDGQRLLGHALVRLRGEGDGELPIGIGDGRATRDPLIAAIERQPWEDPAAPDRKADGPRHMPTHLRAGHRHARVGRGGAGEHDLAAERCRLFRRGELHEELRPLVLLDADADSAGEAVRAGGLGENRPLAR